MVVSNVHQRNIAIATLKMSIAGANIAGGMNHKEAVDFLLSNGVAKEKIIILLNNNGHSKEDIKSFFE